MSLFLEFLTKLLWGTGELHHQNELWLFFFSSLKTNMQNFLNVKIFFPSHLFFLRFWVFMASTRTRLNRKQRTSLF